MELTAPSCKNGCELLLDLVVGARISGKMLQRIGELTVGEGSYYLTSELNHPSAMATWTYSGTCGHRSPRQL